MRKILSVLIAGLLGLTLSVQAATQNLLEVAGQSGQFTTFLRAIEAAGLTEALSQQGPYTLLAPNDAAFEKIPKQELAALMQDRKTLQTLVAYHVLPGKKASADLKDGPVKTVQGISLTVNSQAGKQVENAKLVSADIEASNGVVHGIDSVILPR
ncbi:MAG: fasciclin domain-containing protein [Burkholderiaceae bacterium]